jgi:hypothetical protein
MNRPGVSVRASVVAGAAVAVMLGGCAAPGSTASARRGVSPLPSSAVPSSAGPAPASSSDPGLGDTRPPCPSAEFQSILGPNVTRSVWTTPTAHRPFGDVGVNFGPQLPGATVLWARLDVVPADPVPMSFNPTADPRAFESAEAARPDSSEKLGAGSELHVARVTLKPFAEGPFVLPAATLNALPTDGASYNVFLVESVDESACFDATPDPSLANLDDGNGESIIGVLAP